MALLLSINKPSEPFVCTGVKQVKTREYTMDELLLRSGSAVHYNDEVARLAQEKKEKAFEEEKARIEALSKHICETFGTEACKALEESDMLTPEEVEARRQEKLNNPVNKPVVYTPKTHEMSYWEVENILERKSLNEEDTYVIDGVTFTGTEMKQFKDLYNGIASMMPPLQDDLDYRDYARMGIGISTAKAYAKENMTGEQAEIVEKVIRYYTDKIKYMEDAMLKSMNVKTDSSKRYYNRLVDVADDMKSEETTYAKAVGSASDKGLTKQIMELFANVNLFNANSIQNAINTYKQIIIPAYMELNGSRYGSEIASDETKLNSWIANAKALNENIKQSGIDIKV